MKLLIIILLLLLSGCDYFMSDVEKSKTEKKQYQELVEQNQHLDRIANALEKIANK